MRVVVRTVFSLRQINCFLFLMVQDSLCFRISFLSSLSARQRRCSSTIVVRSSSGSDEKGFSAGLIGTSRDRKLQMLEARFSSSYQSDLSQKDGKDNSGANVGDKDNDPLAAVVVAAMKCAYVARDGVGSSSENPNTGSEMGHSNGTDVADKNDYNAREALLSSLETLASYLRAAPRDSVLSSSLFQWACSAPCAFRVLLWANDPSSSDTVVRVWLEVVPPPLSTSHEHAEIGGSTNRISGGVPRPTVPGMLTFSKVVNGALEVVSRVGSSGGREISRRRVSQDDSAWQSLGGVTRQMFHQWRSEVKSNADSNNDSERAGMPVTSTLWSDSGNIEQTRSAVMVEVDLIPPARDYPDIAVLLPGFGDSTDKSCASLPVLISNPVVAAPDSQEHPSPTNISSYSSWFFERSLHIPSGLGAYAEKRNVWSNTLQSSIISRPEKLGEIGGLSEELATIARRVLASRTLPPKQAAALGIGHVRGLLLYGPPGCGKTLLARQISDALDAVDCRLVSGPEILNKFIGMSEEKIRNLFAPAERAWEAEGPASGLHVIVFDEIDAICRERGSLSGDTSGVRDSVVNQLLAKLDGVRTCGNVLVIGMTNAKHLIDAAMLRPGRLEVHVEVGMPNRAAREEIFHIHTRGLRSEGRLAMIERDNGAADDRLERLEVDMVTDDAYEVTGIRNEAKKGVDMLLEELARDSNTGGFSGAECAGLVRSAASYALERFFTVDNEKNESEEFSEEIELQVLSVDFWRALGEMQAQRQAAGNSDGASSVTPGSSTPPSTLDSPSGVCLDATNFSLFSPSPTAAADRDALDSFLASIGLACYAPVLAAHEITALRELQLLDEEGLEKAGLSVLGHRLRVLAHVPKAAAAAEAARTSGGMAA